MTATSLLLLALQCSMLGLAPGLQLVIDPPQGCEDDVMQKLIDEVEMHDRRLVVRNVYPAQKEKQDELAARGAIDLLDCAMQQRNLPEGHRLAAEFTHMMTVLNEPTKILVGQTTNVISTLAKLVNWSVHFERIDDIVVEDAENAAEAIWTLTRTGLADIHNKLNRTNVADDLAAMLERNVPPMTPKGYMWASAALGSMMKSYREDNVDLITEHVRARIAQRPDFIELLMNKTKEGTATTGTQRSQMPSHAERLPESRNYSHIYGWGAESALAGLAFEQSVQEQLANTHGAHELFCVLSVSYDDLEKEEATTILELAFKHMDCSRYASVQVAAQHTEERSRAWEERQRAADARAAKKHADETARRARVAVHVPGNVAEEAKKAADTEANEEARKKAADAKAAKEAKEAADKKANEEARKRAADAKAAEEAKEAADTEANEEARKKAADAKAAEEAKEAADEKANEEARKKAADAKAAEEAKEAADKKANEEARKKATDANAATKAKEAADRKAQEDAKKAADKQAQEDARKKDR